MPRKGKKRRPKTTQEGLQADRKRKATLKKKVEASERITCPACGKVFSKSCSPSHYNGQIRTHRALCGRLCSNSYPWVEENVCGQQGRDEVRFANLGNPYHHPDNETCDSKMCVRRRLKTENKKLRDAKDGYHGQP